MTSQLPLIVLIGGLLCGVGIALWGGRRTRQQATLSGGAGTLRARDLRLQLEELYNDLRDDGLPQRERDALELRAAKTLQELELLPSAQTEQEASASSIAQPAQPTRESMPTSFSGRHPLLAGALLGGGMVALIAALIALAFRDTGMTDGAANSAAGTAGSPMSPMSGAPAIGSPSDGSNTNFRGEPNLPAGAAQQVAAMRETLVLQPNDLATRHQLIETLLVHEQHFDAFQEANQALELNPNDPVANYAAGFVRYVMGSTDAAMQHLDSAIAADPNYSQAFLVRGLIQLQTEQRDAAIASWESGFAASGGTDGRLRHLIDLARQGLSFQEILQRPPGS